MDSIESFGQAESYIEELPKFTTKHPQEHTREFLRRLSCLEVDKTIVHVAGTNGKGSVCIYLQAILLAEGKRTGLFLSPHLVSLRERIRLDGKLVFEEQFLKGYHKAKTVAKEMEQEGLGHPSYFEFLFGIAMLVFRESEAEYLILETGLGGRLDATNALEGCHLSVITSIGLDHTGILGDSISAIAGEKAGIIKDGGKVIFDGNQEEAAKVIEKVAKAKKATWESVTDSDDVLQESRENKIAFFRRNAYDESVLYRISSGALYQIRNVELALRAAESLLQTKAVRRAGWKAAIEAVTWEGRMEELTPRLTVDGAHNPPAIEAFLESLSLTEPERLAESVLLFSAVKDKDYRRMIRLLCKRAQVKAYVVTQIEEERGVPVQELEEIFRTYTTKEVIGKPTLAESLREADKRCGKEGRVYAVGSLYLAGMIKKWLTGGKGYA